jgi:hypothetical protein
LSLKSDDLFSPPVLFLKSASRSEIFPQREGNGGEWLVAGWWWALYNSGSPVFVHHFAIMTTRTTTTTTTRRVDEGIESFFSDSWKSRSSTPKVFQRAREVHLAELDVHNTNQRERETTVERERGECNRENVFPSSSSSKK